MRKFEYHIFNIRPSYGDVQNSTVVQLNSLGKTGWELVELEHRYEPYMREGNKEPGLKYALMKREFTL